jgi:hypothetical protein
MKPDRDWVLLPFGALRSTCELAGANRPAMCKDKQPSML